MSSGRNVFLRKPVEHFEEDMRQSGLNRVLGKWGLTAIGIGAIIGAGIFVMTGVGAKEYAGPALALSFVVAGIGCTFAALCYAEFASFLPVEGSAYAYSYATMGELFAWIIGWDLILEYAMGASAVAVGWSGYVGKFLHLFDIRLPLWLMNDAFTASNLLAEAATNAVKHAELLSTYSDTSLPVIMGHSFAINLPAFLIIWVITGILVKGIKEAASTNTLMVVLKLAVVLFIIIVGVNYIDTANWHPFIPARQHITNPDGTNPHDAYGLMGILSGAGYIFFAYIGFDTVSTQAGEAKNPQKDVPFGIIASLIVCTLLYILVALIITGMVNYKDIDITAPISAAFGSKGLSFAVLIISIAAIAGLTSVLIVMLLGQSRVFYAIAKDGLLPKRVFGALHKRFQTPYKASLLTGLAVSLVSAFTPISVIAEMVNIGTLLAFVMVCCAVWIMRYKEPDRYRPFRAPYIPVVATLGILFNLGMMLSLGWVNWLRLIIWLAIGFAIYFFYGRYNSKLQNSVTSKQ
jgi:APA family basic amino acid/polyamine antiporter